jgi:hypothetical protein
MKYYFSKDDDIIKSSLNKPFPVLFRCSDKEFDKWVENLAVAVARKWNEESQPPKSGVPLEQFGAQFERICSIDTGKFWIKDEQSRRMDCVADTARVPIANSFFPNILKAKDTVSEGDAVSVYDMYADENRRDALNAVMRKAIRRDGFYEFSPIYRVKSGFKGSLRRHAVQQGQQWLEEEEAKTGNTSFWLEQAQKTEQKTPRISGKEIKQLADKGLLKAYHLPQIAVDDIDDESLFRFRVYGINDKARTVLPEAYRFVELGVEFSCWYCEVIIRVWT